MSTPCSLTTSGQDTIAKASAAAQASPISRRRPGNAMTALSASSTTMSKMALPREGSTSTNQPPATK